MYSFALFYCIEQNPGILEKSTFLVQSVRIVIEGSNEIVQTVK